MKFGLDTNILVYAEGLGDAQRCDIALRLIDTLPIGQVVLSAQVLGELSRVLITKARRSPNQVRETILEWADVFTVADSTWPAFQAALDLLADHYLPMWDALILAVFAENNCRILLSEDFQDGFTWRGVTVVNPFAATVSPLLKHYLY